MEEYAWGPGFTDYATKIALDFAKKEESEHHYEKIGFQITESVENHTWSTNGETLNEIKMEIDMGTD